MDESEFRDLFTYMRNRAETEGLYDIEMGFIEQLDMTRGYRVAVLEYLDTLEKALRARSFDTKQKSLKLINENLISGGADMLTGISLIAVDGDVQRLGFEEQELEGELWAEQFADEVERLRRELTNTPYQTPDPKIG
jgi:hypothetical protein